MPFRQLGQYEDVETSLYYNRFRYYSPDTGTYISQDPIGLLGGLSFYAYVHDVNSWVDVFGLSGQRWMNKIKKDGSPFKKPGPKPKGEGAHNLKIQEIIEREISKLGVKHIGGGEATEITLKTDGSKKPYRRMDISFINAEGIEYHINVGRTLNDGITGIKREREAIEDVLKSGYNITFEGYAKDSQFRKKSKKHH